MGTGARFSRGDSRANIPAGVERLERMDSDDGRIISLNFSWSNLFSFEDLKANGSTRTCKVLPDYVSYFTYDFRLDTLLCRCSLKETEKYIQLKMIREDVFT